MAEIKRRDCPKQQRRLDQPSINRNRRRHKRRKELALPIPITKLYSSENTLQLCQLAEELFQHCRKYGANLQLANQEEQPVKESEENGKSNEIPSVSEKPSIAIKPCYVRLERCQVPVKPVCAPRDLEEVTKSDINIIIQLLERHCLFCLSPKTRMLLSVRSSSMETNGYDLFHKYVGIKTENCINDIFESMISANKSLSTAEIPAPLLCEKCVELVGELDQMHQNQEVTHWHILQRVRLLNKLVVDRHSAVNRRKFEAHLKTALKWDWQSGLEILDRFQKSMNEEINEQMELHAELLKKLDDSGEALQISQKENICEVSVQTEDVAKVSVEEKQMSEELHANFFMYSKLPSPPDSEVGLGEINGNANLGTSNLSEAAESCLTTPPLENAAPMETDQTESSENEKMSSTSDFLTTESSAVVVAHEKVEVHQNVYAFPELPPELIFITSDSDSNIRPISSEKLTVVLHALGGKTELEIMPENNVDSVLTSPTSIAGSDEETVPQTEPSFSDPGATTNSTYPSHSATPTTEISVQSERPVSLPMESPPAEIILEYTCSEDEEYEDDDIIQFVNLDSDSEPETGNINLA